MTLTTSDQLGELGVNFLREQALRSGWLFRPVSIFDVGVDAELELCEEDEPTGRLIAAQIKTGPSYFSRPSKNGWHHPVTKKHAAYWKNHSLPVLVVLVDDEAKVAYWELVTSGTLKAAGKNFKIEIRRTQVISTASEEWARIARGRDYEAALQFEPNLSVLPPSVATRLRLVLQEDRSSATLLAMELADGRFEVANVVSNLLANPPRWLTPSSGSLWRAIAMFAFEHAQHALAADALERAADIADHPSELLIQAGQMVVGVDNARAVDLADRASLKLGESFGVKLLRLQAKDGIAGAVREQIRGTGIDLDVAEALLDVHARLLALQVAVAQSRYDEAVGHGQAILDMTPESSGAMLTLAQALLSRSRSHLSQPGDLQRATTLAATAVDQRHQWNGPTEPFLETALQGFHLAGDHAEVLRRSLITPFGIATAQEAARADVARWALVAGALLGQTQHRDEVLAHIADADVSRLLSIEFPAPGTSVTKTERVQAWEERLTRALAEKDFPTIDHAIRVLAIDGVDRSADVMGLDVTYLGDDFVDLVKAVALSTTDIDAALPTLRRLATKDPGATHYLAATLRSHGRPKEAAAVLAEGTTRFNTTEFLSEEIAYLVHAGDHSGAETVASNALGRRDFIGRDRAAALHLLQQLAFKRRDWPRAERHGRDALDALGFSEPEIGWNVVRALLNRQARSEASQFIRAKSLSPDTTDEVSMWLIAFPLEEWGTDELAEAVKLAIRFEGDLNISAAILGRIAASGGGDNLDDDEAKGLHVKGMELLASHVAQFGDASPIKFVPGDVDSIIEMLQKQWNSNSASIKLSTFLARQGRIPLGAYANSLRRPYSFVYIQKPFGYLPAGAFPDAIHESEVGVAGSTLGKRVVTDLTALVTSSLLGEKDSGREEFQARLLHPDGAADLYAGAAELQNLANSAGSMGWDPRAERPTLREFDEDEKAEMVAHSALLKRAVQFAEVSDRLPLSGELVDLPPEAHAWAGSIELARSTGLPLWSDDSAQRALALAMGVEAFGTPALLEAISRKSIRNQPGAPDKAIARLHDGLSRLVALGAVDIQLPAEELIDLAEKEKWTGFLSSLPLSRASWWAWTPEPLTELQKLLVTVHNRNPDHLPGWQARAMTGVTLALGGNPEQSALWLAIIALLPIAGPDAEAGVRALRLAREIANGFEVTDPRDSIVLAAQYLHSMGLLSDSADFVRELFIRLSGNDS